MSEELKPCLYCGKQPEKNSRYTSVWCVSSRDECPYSRLAMSPEEWNPRPLEDKLRAELARKDELIKRLDEYESLQTIEEWHENDGTALWWRYPIQEAPYVGSPLDDDWLEDYYTHWTRIPRALLAEVRDGVTP